MKSNPILKPPVPDKHYNPATLLSLTYAESSPYANLIEASTND